MRYIVIRKAVSSDLACFVYNYFLMKRQVAETMRNTQYIPPSTTDWGTWEDSQVPNTYSHYGDIAMETLLLKVQPVIEKKIKLRLSPTYSYARIYKNGDVLARHKDRFSCELSATMNLGGDHWPIYLNPNPKGGHVYGPLKGVHGVQDYQPSKSKGVKVDLKPGDMLVYSGCELEHWRKEFKGDECAQVFLHYNIDDYLSNTVVRGKAANIYDTRKHLGLPIAFKHRDAE